MYMVILEDDERRAEAMCQQVRKRFPEVECIVFDNAPDMITWMKTSLSSIALLSLDHDLGANRNRDGETFDPGTGRDVANYLTTQEPTCPVIIHSSNYVGATGMEFALEYAGWTHERVLPYDDLAWVESPWINMVEKFLEALSVKN